MIRRLLLALAFSLFASNVHAQTFRVPFRSVDGLILLDVKVNGKPSTILLDTGANVSLLRHAPVNATAVEPPLEYLVSCSAQSLLDLELAALNRSSNCLKAARLEWEEAVAHREIAGVAAGEPNRRNSSGTGVSKLGCSPLDR